MEKEEDEARTIFAAQELPVAAQEMVDTIVSTDQPFSNAKLTFIRKAMATLQASILERLKAHTREAIVYIGSSCPDKDGSEGDNQLTNFVERIVRGVMVSSRFMTKADEAANDTVVFRANPE